MSQVLTVMGLLLSVSMPPAMPDSEWARPTEDARVHGKATYMVPGLMETVASNRGMDLEGYVSGVALNRAGDLGRVVWLEWEDGSVYGPFLVVDCAQRVHFARREGQGYVVEVPGWVARMRGFFGTGPTDVVVWFADPRNGIDLSEKGWI